MTATYASSQRSTPSQIEGWIAELLERAGGMTLDELRNLDAEYRLSPDQQSLLVRAESLEWLLRR